MHLQCTLILSSLLLVGCATNATVPPSQNSSLNTVSPNTAAASKGGAMQSSLDSWLKEDWMPNSVTPSSSDSIRGSISNEELDSRLHGNDKKEITTNSVASKPANEKPFTLQGYADKWKAYHENKEKMNEGKPKEASHIDAVNALPVIGK